MLDNKFKVTEKLSQSMKNKAEESMRQKKLERKIRI